MKPAISQVCSLHSSFEKDLEDYATFQCPAMEVWLTKLETYIERHSLDETKAIVAESQITLPVASYQGGILLSQGDARKEHWNHFEKRLQLCQSFKINTLIVVADFFGELTQQAMERACVSLQQAAQKASEHQVRIAVEFQAKANFCNNLLTAIALVEQCGHPALGICLDSFHFYTGASKTEDLALLSKERLFHVQVSDLCGVFRETATDADRILPGDGDIPFASLVNYLKQIDYQDYVSLELMNPTLWEVGAQQTGEVGLTSLRRLLGQASME